MRNIQRYAAVFSFVLAGFLAACAQPTAPESPAGGAVSHENVVIITSTEQFDQTVAQGFVLVDFWATWCPPCRYMNPIVAEVAGEQADSLALAKVDVDNNRELAERYRIESIPTFILFKDGKAVDMKVGAFPKEMLVDWLAKHRG